MKHLYAIIIAILLSFPAFAVLPITGPTAVCTGATIAMSDATPGGTWSSSDMTIAATGSISGLVTGVAAGTATITYDVSGVYVTTVVTVNMVPAPVLTPAAECQYANFTLSDATTGGTWTSSNSSVAGIYSGIYVYCSTPGTATINYTLPTGCAASQLVTVTSMPGALYGPSAICLGGSVVLSDASGGGTWTSSNPAVATIGLTTGTVTSLTVGTAAMTYSTGPVGCYAIQRMTVTTSGGTITGPSSICLGSSPSLNDVYSGGTWMSSGPSLSIGLTTGIMTGSSAGSATITYTLGTGCTATYPVTVTSTAGPAPITGPSTLCSGSTISLSDATSGGSWTASGTVVAVLMSPPGTVYGGSPGSETITYSIGPGCIAVHSITVSVSPSSIMGPSVVCLGATATLSDYYTGGTWTTSGPAVSIGLTSGIATGLSTGTALVTYSLGGSCTDVYTTLTVLPLPAIYTITGGGSFCAGGSGMPIGLSGSVTGINYQVYLGSTLLSTTPGTGLALSFGLFTAGGTYTVVAVNPTTGCSTNMSGSATIIVYPIPSPISGTTSACVGSTTALSDAVAGGTWSSSNSTIAIVGTGTGVVTGVSTGTCLITYTLSTGCDVQATLTVNALPAVSASSSPSACGDTYTLTSGGAVLYSWAPSTGLSCPTCATTTVNLPGTTTYTVSGTDANGCVNANTVTITGDRIFGHIAFSSATPDTLDMKVWLVQFDPSDSSITALDSMTTCTVDSIGYYEFDSKPTGNYLVKAKLLYGNPMGSSGYVPTYGSSTPNWYAAASVSHTAGLSDSLHINMVYGTVPFGPGFIGGYVYAGAGKGTSGDVAAPGMLIYLENTATKVLTYTYTDGTGAYSFNNIAYGDYVIYPEEYVYNTTPSSVIKLNATTPRANAVDFRQYTMSKKIAPLSYTIVICQQLPDGLSVFPNPTSGMLNIQWQDQPMASGTAMITDMLGHEVYRSALNINSLSGQMQINTGLGDGIYFLSVNCGALNYNGKLIIQH
jgi:uncharacterized protein YjdB